MEVHHHPHLPHGEKKKFKEYFLEFLMLFLAVTLGFFAESLREHFTETKTAHQYLESYRNDLLENQIQFKRYDSIFNNLIPVYDSIVNIFYTKRENTELPVLSKLLYGGQRNIVITINNSTYQQMVSSGSMRYLKNLPLMDSIANYNDGLNSLINYNDRLLSGEDNVLEKLGEIEDWHDFLNVKKMKGDDFDYAPDMQPFSLTDDQRRFLISYYKVYTIQAYSDGMMLKHLMNINKSLVKMVNKELHQ
jgi:hypothetical protein